jgi:hypothetical protein
MNDSACELPNPCQSVCARSLLAHRDVNRGVSQWGFFRLCSLGFGSILIALLQFCERHDRLNFRERPERRVILRSFGAFLVLSTFNQEEGKWNPSN